MLTETGTPALHGATGALAGTAVLVVLLLGLSFDARILTWFAGHRLRWTRCLVRLRQRPWSAEAGLLVLLPLVLLYVGIMLVGQLGADRLTLVGDTTRFALTAGGTLLLHGAVVAVILFTMRRQGYLWKDAYDTPERIPTGQLARWSLYGYAAMLPLVTGAALVAQFALHTLGSPAAPQHILNVFTMPDTPVWFRWAVGFMAVVTAPIAEEMLFRGILLPLLLQRYSVTLAFLVSALVFGLMHGHIPALAPLMVVGLAHALAYTATGAIAVPILMHALFNGVSLALALLLAV